MNRVPTKTKPLTPTHWNDKTKLRLPRLMILLQKLSIPSGVDLEDIVDGLLDLKAGSQNGLNAVEHLKVYIEFVEQHVVPMWVEARGSTKYKVLFFDLPMHFRPGHVLSEPLKLTDDKNNSGNAGSNPAQTRD